MANTQPPRNPNLKSNVRIRTIIAVAAFTLGAFGLLIYQLYALQLRDAEHYRTEAVTQQLQDTELPATRGNIYSANGKLLAKRSNTVWNIIADPAQSEKNGATETEIRTGAEQIAELLNDGTSADDIYAKLTARNKNGELYQYRVVAQNVEKPVADAIIEYSKAYRTAPEKEGETGYRIAVLSTEQSTTRSYPYGAFASSVIGFCNNDENGKLVGAYGLEKSYEEELAGTPGRSIAETNVNGEILANTEADVHDAIDGNNLNLTLDENVQAIVEEYLAEAMETFSVHGRGSAIVMNVKTGAILAMASLEQFDPNDPMFIYDDKMQTILDKTDTLTADDIDWLEGRLGEKNVAGIIADGVISQETTEDENGNTISSEYTQLQGMLREAQWKNKNITELYMPGSIFKLITASAGLDSGIMNMNQTFYCNGELTVNQGSELWEHTYHCANGEVHNLQNMAQALDNSCNLWFIQAAQTLQQMAEVDTNLYTAAFGQNEAITPMQMATAIAAIANGGYLVTPYIVDSITDDAGNIISQTDTSVRRQVISEEVSQEILSMMENNVDPNGTLSIRHSCKNAYVAGYRIGGKSGTAERTDRHLRGDGDYYKAMSFSAVLPINDPEIEVFVLLDDPRWIHDYEIVMVINLGWVKEGQYDKILQEINSVKISCHGNISSQVVAPVVGNIISEVAPYLGIEQDANYNPTGNVTVQTCLDYTWTNAQVTLNQLGLQHKLIGSNGNIVYQYPVGGSSVPVGSTIYLYTNTDQDAMTTVPDVTGKSGSFASQMLKASNLNVQFEGDSSGRVVSQSTAAETSAAYGTIVTLTMESDGSEDAAEIPAEETPAEETPAEETQEQ